MQHPFRIHREKAGLTQADLSCIIGKSASAVAHYERGFKTPPEDIVNIVAKSLDIKPDALNQEIASWERKRMRAIQRKIKSSQTSA